MRASHSRRVRSARYAAESALPDARRARRVLTESRGMSPDVDIIIRSHSDAEQAYMIGKGATEVIVAEQELAVEMVHHTTCAGADDATIDAMLFAGRHRRVPGSSNEMDSGQVSWGTDPHLP
jgi:voltage-gated potassium channel Kch